MSQTVKIIESEYLKRGISSQWIHALYIPLRGNFSLRKKTVYILFTFLKWLGVFSLDFDTLIKVSVKTFLDPYAYYLKLRMCNSILVNKSRGYSLINTIYKFPGMISVENLH